VPLAQGYLLGRPSSAEENAAAAPVRLPGRRSASKLRDRDRDVSVPVTRQRAVS
jgi:hypothetical protein